MIGSGWGGDFCSGGEVIGIQGKSPLNTDEAAEKISPADSRLRLHGTIDITLLVARCARRDLDSCLRVEAPLFDSPEDGIISSTVAHRLLENDCGLVSGRHCSRRRTAEKMNKVLRGSTVLTHLEVSLLAFPWFARWTPRFSQLWTSLDL